MHLAGLAIRSLVLIVALAANAPLAAQGNAITDGLVFECETWSFDGITNRMRCSRPVIRHGTLEIDADEALATDVELDRNSEIRFTGHVRIRADGTTLEASSAVFAFADRELSRAELVGAPASFTAARSDTGESPARGSADKISFDYAGKTLRLREHVEVTRDRYIWRSCDVIYDLKNEAVMSGSVCSERHEILKLPAPREGSTISNPAPP
jgi:lipopolysaccharide transport protein LptA